ncbi:copper homeostasis protein CutC [Pontimicrobium sp. IMCC45349]|uniref:copper homeostasis protein CutC n=1 Tax=Pontimicrobium sp. IMCC45349 TaxID=3391574 RepID=UPI00399F272E
MTLEICASNYQSASNAQEAGADRIELCQELAIGGITPSYGLLKQVLDTLDIPVFVLIRPRSGNFTYSDAEFDIMKQNILLCKDLGASGIVSGVLNLDNTIDIERTQELIELSKPLPFTFHRAFDWTPKPVKAMYSLIEIGVERILSSGQQASAEKGLELLTKLKDKAQNRINILPGGGINSSNASIFKANSFNEIHASASTIKTVSEIPEISMNSSKFLSDTDIYYSDETNIKSIIQSLHA